MQPVRTSSLGRGFWRRAAAGVLLAALIGTFAAIGSAARWTDPETWAPALAAARQSSFFVPAGMVLVGVATAAMVPLTPVLVAVGSTLPGPVGFAIAWGGTLLGAILTHAAARRLGAAAVAPRVPAVLNDRLLRPDARGWVALAFLRMLPVSHFGVFNAALGAAGYPVGPFFASTALGITPVVAAYFYLGERLRHAWSNPRPETWVLLAAWAAALVGATVLLTRKARAAPQM